jgi:adenylate kinase
VNQQVGTAGRKPRLVIMGRQGAGKGTQCAFLENHYEIQHLSTGDVLRGAVAEGTELGVQAKAIMDAGGLVDDDLMRALVADRIGDADEADGYLLDGYPRTIAQAEALLEMAAPRGIDACINLDVPLDEVRTRMVARGREDDTPEAIDRRLELYEQETAPLLSWFEDKSLLLTVDGLGDVNEIASRLSDALDAFMAAKA